MIEVTSTKTRKKDALTKPDLYASLGVPEYFVYDPDQGYLDPSLQGYRMVQGRYERIAPEPDGSLVCQELELRLWDDGEDLQLFRIDNGQRLVTGRELAASETQKRLEAEAEIERLKAELARQTGKSRN